MPYGSSARLYYERHGSGEPLLLITGFTISSAVFEPVLELYARALRVHPLRQPRLGPLGAPLARPRCRSWPPTRRACCARSASTSAHVYGVSMGGMIAQELAIRFPERVRGLVLGGTTPGGPRAVRPALGELARSARRDRRAGERRGRGSGVLFSPEFRREQPERMRELLRYFADTGEARGAVGALVGDGLPRHGLAARRDPGADARDARRRDAMAPIANARLLAERIPDAELASCPGAGHAYALERPEESLALLARWLDRRGPIPAGTAAHRGGGARRAGHTRARSADRRRCAPERASPGSGAERSKRECMWRLTDEQRELREQISGVRARGDPRRACARSTRTASTRATSTR